MLNGVEHETGSGLAWSVSNNEDQISAYKGTEPKLLRCRNDNARSTWPANSMLNKGDVFTWRGTRKLRRLTWMGTTAPARDLAAIIAKGQGVGWGSILQRTDRNSISQRLVFRFVAHRVCLEIVKRKVATLDALWRSAFRDPPRCRHFGECLRVIPSSVC